MSIASQARALLTVLDARDFDAMPPAERRRFADLCRHVASMAEPKAAKPTVGVLADVRAYGVHAE